VVVGAHLGVFDGRLVARIGHTDGICHIERRRAETTRARHGHAAENLAADHHVFTDSVDPEGRARRLAGELDLDAGHLLPEPIRRESEVKGSPLVAYLMDFYLHSRHDADHSRRETKPVHYSEAKGSQARPAPRHSAKSLLRLTG